MIEQEFLNIVNRIADSEKIEIKNTDHLQNGNMLRSGLNFYSDTAKQQYLGLINPGIHLPTVLNKLEGMEMKEDPGDFVRYNPAEISDNLIRLCELTRTKPIYGYKVSDMDLIYGCVSDQHTFVNDRDIHKITETFFDSMPHNVSLNHSIYRMVMQYELPEMAIPLGNDNSMNFRVSVGNSQFGVGSLFVEAGSYEKICTNGSMAWISQFSWRADHRRTTSKSLLERLVSGLNTILSKADKYMALLQQANETVIPIIKAEESVVKVLRSKRFNLLKREAESIYRRIRANPRYQRMNGFDLGRAIAEEARDIPGIDRAIELEQLAGRVMISQVI